MLKFVSILAVTVAAFVLPTAPVLANNSASHIGEPSIKAPCTSYTQNADGTWTPIPCEEAGSKSPAPKPATHSSNETR